MFSKTVVYCLLFVATKGGTPDTNPTSTTCTLQYQNIGRSTSSEQSVSQYLTSMEESPRNIKDFPHNISQSSVYFSIRLGSKDFYLLLDRLDNPKKPFVLYIDSDNDFYFSDESPYFSSSIKPGWFGPYDKYRFGPISVVLETEAGKQKITFHITTIYGERLSIYPCRYRRGNLILGDQNYVVSVIDGNLDGLYETTKFTERVTPSGMDSIGILSAKSSPRRQNDNILVPLTKMTRIGNDFYDIDLTSDGGTLKLKPVILKYGTLTMQDSGCEISLRLWSTITAQTFTGSGPWKIPEGRYKNLGFTLYKKDKSGAVWELENIPLSSSPDLIEIQPNLTIAVAYGEPIQLQTYVKKSNSKNYDYSIGYNYLGKNGERYFPSFSKNGTRDNAPFLRIIDQRANIVQTGQLKYG